MEDADAWMQQTGPGGPFDGLPVVVVTLQIGQIGPGVRGAFARPVEEASKAGRWMAVVVTNPVLRVTTNFVVRIAKTKRLRLFDTEEEAVRWLDERVREGAGKAAP